MNTEDGYIVGKCLEGDSAAFSLLVDKYKASVYALAYSRLRNFHNAEDVTQEVFIKAYKKLRTLRRWDNFLAWIYSITINLCKDWLRSQSRRPDADFIEDQSPETLHDSSIQSHNEQKIFEMLHESLDSLPDTCREVLILYYLGGLNSVEIAAIRGVSPAIIRQQLTRSRAQLKEEVLNTISTTFKDRRLQAGFTFRVTEMVKHIKIQPVPRIKGIPWYISIAAGLIFTIISYNHPFDFLKPSGEQSGMPIASQIEVIKTSEIPVDVMKISRTTIISTKNNKTGTPGYFKRAEASSPFANARGGKWLKRADMPTGRLVLSACSLNDTVYAIGGMRDGWETLPTVEAYNAIIEKWTKKADMPTPRYGLSTAVLNWKIYAVGGTTVVGPKVLSAVEKYDPIADKWTKKADMLASRSGLSVSVLNGKIYAIGGVGTDFVSALNTVEEYDPHTDTWIKKTDMPTARTSLGTETINGKIYAIGGQTSIWGEYRGNYTSIVEEYDPVYDKWTRKADMPTARAFFCTAVMDGKIFVMGGITKEYGTNGLSTVEVYEPSTDTWSTAYDIPTSRFCLAGAAINGRIYAIGGIREGDENFTGLSIVEEYVPEY
jgi:RNA polymerase sigma factor (sigma-70 family)